MKKNNSTITKFVIATLATLTLVAPLSITSELRIQSQKAQAVSVYVTGGRLDFVASIPSLEAPAQTTAVSTANIAGQQKVEYFETKALAILKRQLLNKIVDDIINWINGGGEPRFVADWEGFLDDAAGLAIGSVVQELGLGVLCSPFSAQLQIAVASSQRRNFTGAITCTLDDIVENIDSFFYNFESGGWIGYYESWQPQNNFFGSYLIAQEEINSRAASAQLAAQNEALAGGGILSTKSCKEAGDTSSPASGPDIDGDKLYGDYDCEITTPGSVVQDLLGKALTVDIDLILASEDLSEYIGSIANALINRVIREGVNGLRGLTSNSNPGNDFSIPNPPSSPCDGLEGDLLSACLSYQGIANVSFENSRQRLLSDIEESLGFRRTSLATLQEMVTLWEEHIVNLEDSNFCSSATDFLDLANGQKQLLETQVALEQSAVNELEAAEIEISGLGNAEWGLLIEIEFNLAAVSNPGTAETFSERVAEEKTAQEEEIESQENICNLSNSSNSGINYS